VAAEKGGKKRGKIDDWNSFVVEEKKARSNKRHHHLRSSTDALSVGRGA